MGVFLLQINPKNLDPSGLEHSNEGSQHIFSANNIKKYYL